jgi:glycosyltransferase involved in cell wall biosynthesis
MEKLTIVIPVFNRAAIVCRTLDSVEAQSYRNIAVIIVDNASTDDSYAVVESWIARHSDSDIHYRQLREPHPGAANARRCGANAVNTPYIAFFDSDDTMSADYAQSIIETFERNPSATLVYWKKRTVDLHGHTFASRFSHPRDILNKHIFHAVLSTQSYAMTTTLYHSCGGWDGSVMKWDDWELGIRLIFAKGFNPVPIHKTLVTIYIQQESITGSDFHSAHGGWEYAIDRAEAFAHTLHDSSHLLRLLAYKRMVLAGNYAKEGATALALQTRHDALNKVSTSAKMQLILKFTYFYVRHGWRGCASIVGRLI